MKNKQVFITRKYIYASNALKKTQIYLLCLWTFYKRRKNAYKFQEVRDSTYIYESDLDKACFQGDMAHGDFKDLPRKIK